MIMIIVIAVAILKFIIIFTAYTHTQFNIQLVFLWCNLRSHGDFQLC